MEIDKLYGKVTLFNIYRLIGELAAKVSKDEAFINVNPDEPAVTEKDLLTLMFDAMAMLPTNDLRSKAITANNAIKQVASAPQTIAGIYATLLTGLSVYGPSPCCPGAFRTPSISRDSPSHGGWA